MGDDDSKTKQLAMGGSSAVKKETLPPTTFPRLEGEDYAMWAIKMECAMEAHEIWDAIDPGGDAYKKGGTEYKKDR